MTGTSHYLFDFNGMNLVSQGRVQTPLSDPSPCQISLDQTCSGHAASNPADRASAPGLGPNSRVPLVYLHRDYHKDERSPKLLDILNDLQHSGPVHALRISSVATANSARGFVQALLELFPTIVVLEDVAQSPEFWDSRFYVLSAECCTDLPMTDQCAGAATLSARFSDLGDHSPSVRS
ncbi:hypothetical protein K4F88_06915 [Phaeobacter inhibens]|nr:hypothetical protein K4F88_06915 [Phaeobacter inhibens]